MKTVLSRAIPPARSSLLAIFAHVAAVSFAAAPAFAASGGNVATLAQPLSAPKQQILGDVLWKCAGDRCTAANSGGRPVLTCQRVAKEFGEVSRFASGTKEFSADDLAKCNAK
jgi:hypothetical protein